MHIRIIPKERLLLEKSITIIWGCSSILSSFFQSVELPLATWGKRMPRGMIHDSWGYCILSAVFFKSSAFIMLHSFVSVHYQFQVSLALTKPSHQQGSALSSVGSSHMLTITTVGRVVYIFMVNFVILLTTSLRMWLPGSASKMVRI